MEKGQPANRPLCPTFTPSAGPKILFDCLPNIPSFFGGTSQFCPSFLHTPHTRSTQFLRGKTFLEKGEGLNDSNSCPQILPGRRRGSAIAQWHLGWHQDTSLTPMPEGHSQTGHQHWGAARRERWRKITTKSRNDEQRLKWERWNEEPSAVGGRDPGVSDWAGQGVWEKWLEPCRSRRWGMESAVRGSH